MTMAYLGIFTAEGFTKEKYEELRKEVGWEQNPPAGAIFHAAGFDSSGNIRVADIWESEQEFNNYFTTVG